MEREKFFRWLKDASERVFWTFIAAGVAGLSVEVFDLPSWAFVPATTALTMLKVWVAKHVGQKDSASLTENI